MQDGIGRIADTDSICEDPVVPPVLEEACNTDPCPSAFFVETPYGGCSAQCATVDPNPDTRQLVIPMRPVDVTCMIGDVEAANVTDCTLCKRNGTVLGSFAAQDYNVSLCDYVPTGPVPATMQPCNTDPCELHIYNAGELRAPSGRGGGVQLCALSVFPHVFPAPSLHQGRTPDAFLPSPVGWGPGRAPCGAKANPTWACPWTWPTVF